MPKINILAMAILFALAAGPAYAEKESFDTHFMVGGFNGEKVDEYWFDETKPLPGDYELDVYLNDQFRGRYELHIKENVDATCLSLAQIDAMGIITKNIPAAKKQDCLPLTIAVQGGSVHYDIGQFNLFLSVPQIYVREYEAGYMPPESWDRGVNALFTSYYASQYYSDYKNGGYSKNSYLNFNSGLNLLGWQLRATTNFTQANDGAGQWHSNTVYLERGIAEVLGTFRAGDMYTSSDMFDSLRFRGVRWFRDMQMLPDSQQNFTPVVRGIAQSNALVTIEQNGFVVYQKEVPPGPFAIQDLHLSGGGADLDVTVKEADGSTSHYLVPYSSVPNMLQPGVTKYDFVAGRSHVEGASNQADFLQASYQYGLNNVLTLYGGVMAADRYHSEVIGTGWNTPIGAVSFDATFSHSKQDNGDVFDGQSYQIAWNKYMQATGTHFALAAWRYSSRGFRTFNDYIWANNKQEYQRDINDVYDIGDYYAEDFGRKNSFSVNVSQTLPDTWGSLALSGLWRDYWQRSGTGKDYQFSYSNSWRQISYTFSASRTQNDDGNHDNRLNLFFSIPFNWGDGITTPRRHLSLTNSTTFEDKYQSNNTSLSGIVGNRDQFSYGVNFSQQQQGHETAVGGNLGWRTPFTTLNGSLSQSNKYNQASASMQGGIVAWSGGIELSNQLSDTFAIVRAPGLKGAAVQGHRYLTTDNQGKAIYSGLTPYRENSLTLDLSHTDSDVSLLGNRRSLAPYRGAVVLTEFETDSRKPWYLRAEQANGDPLPFGHEVMNEAGEYIGLVGQGSLLFMRANEIPPQIRVELDKALQQFCTIALEKHLEDGRVYVCR